jgi:exodeoxyribonuclease VII small subunit
MTSIQPEPPVGRSFEASLDRLGEIVEQMERGAPELDESLALFEEGVRLLRFAEGVLQSADGRIRQLVDDGRGGARLEDFPGEP